MNYVPENLQIRTIKPTRKSKYIYSVMLEFKKFSHSKDVKKKTDGKIKCNSPISSNLIRIPKKYKEMELLITTLLLKILVKLLFEYLILFYTFNRRNLH